MDECMEPRMPTTAPGRLARPVDRRGFFATDILLTKLHAPALPDDWIVRPRLLEHLDQGRLCPLTLVSAPAGYGKSLCVAAWLQTCTESSAWISLDAGESDAGTLTAYLVAAVCGVFAESCPETRALLEAPELPAVPVLARSLANELAAIEVPVILVLDDYQSIEAQAAHDLLCELLAHPLPRLHLILLTRCDPPLPLARLRALGQLSELRIQDLQFNRPESDAFVAQSTRLSLSDRALAHLHDMVEGWPVGLRLVGLALRGQRDPEAFLRGLSGATRNLQDYLVEEVLRGLPIFQREALLKTSILNRFCGPICEAICTHHNDDPASVFEGRAFIESILAKGLFVVPLDEGGVWFRYHHIFQGLLRDHLEKQSIPGRVEALHARAARWFDEQELPDEALHHALAAGDHELARSVVRRHRTDLLNREQWRKLERCLDQLPQSVVAGDAALLVAKAWSGEYRCRSCAVEHLREAEVQLAIARESEPEAEAIQGEIDALRTIQEFDLGHGEQALTCAKRALARLPAEFEHARAYALVIQALAHQSQGEVSRGLELFHAALQDHDADEASRSLPLTGLSFLHWLEGDLARMRQAALENLRIGEEQGLRASVAYAGYLLGILHYMRGELEEAAEHLRRVIDLRFFASQGEYCHSAFALALVHLGQGHDQEAWATFEALSTYVHQTGSTKLLSLVRAFEAEMDLRIGRTAHAVHWSGTASPEPFRSLYMFYVPQLTLARAWLAGSRPERRQAAAKLLDQLLGLPAVAHNVPLRIQALALRALAGAHGSDQTLALERLSEALALAAPGGFVQPFVDLGAPMASLLEQLPPGLSESEQVERIQAAIHAAVSKRAPSAVGGMLIKAGGILFEPLTIREQDVLELLCERLRDKEIAEKLCISPATVKSHLKTLFRKLDVGDRRQAVSRAREIGVLPGASRRLG